MADVEASSTFGAPSNSKVCWTNSLIEVFLDIWGDKYIKIKRGNLGKRHWDEVVNNFNEQTGKSFEHKHLKAKIDGLKKRYRHESADVVNRTGGVRLEWLWYDKCDGFWECTPKAAGMPGAMDSGERIPVYARTIDLNEYAPVDLSDPDISFMSPPGTSTTPIIEPECEDSTPPTIVVDSLRSRACKMPNVEGKLNAKKKRKVGVSPTKPLAESMMVFVETYQKMEETKIQLAREYIDIAQRMHADRLAMEERHAARGEDLKLQLTRMKLEFAGNKRKAPNNEE